MQKSAAIASPRKTEKVLPSFRPAPGVAWCCTVAENANAHIGQLVTSSNASPKLIERPSNRILLARVLRQRHVRLPQERSAASA